MASYDADQNAPEQTTPSQQMAGGSGSGRTLARQYLITLMLGPHGRDL
jgi:hypothetical protein